MPKTTETRHDLKPTRDIAHDGEGTRLLVCHGCGLMMTKATAENTYRRYPCSQDAVIVEVVDASGHYAEPRDRSYADALIQSSKQAAAGAKRREQRAEHDRREREGQAA